MALLDNLNARLMRMEMEIRNREAQLFMLRGGADELRLTIEEAKALEKNCAETHDCVVSEAQTETVYGPVSETPASQA